MLASDHVAGLSFFGDMNDRVGPPNPETIFSPAGGGVSGRLVF